MTVQFSFRMSIDILKENCTVVNSKNIKIEICINKNVFDSLNSLSINDLLENIRILLKYILSRKMKKVKLKNKWRRVKLGDIAEINVNAVNKNCSFEKIEYIDISSVGTGILFNTTEILFTEAPSRAKRLVKNGSTILSTVRPNRRSFYYLKNPKENIIVSTGFAVLDARDGFDSRYLYYIINNQSFSDYLTNHAKGSAYPAVDVNTIENAEINIPLLPTQKKIASILSAYDDLIENNRQRIKLLEKSAHLLYQEWFVHLRFPNYETTKFINGLPEGWEKKKLGEIIKIQKAFIISNRLFAVS